MSISRIGNDLNMVPKLMPEIAQIPQSRVKNAHNTHNRTDLFIAFIPVLNILHVLNHLLNMPSVLGHNEFVSLCIVIHHLFC